MISKNRDYEILGVLRAVRAMLTPRSAWTTEARARNAEGRMVMPEASTAVCWCLLGAIDLVCRKDSTLKGLCRAALGGAQPMMQLNDCDGYQAVIDLLDGGIATLADACPPTSRSPESEPVTDRLPSVRVANS
jgi:hypothetical protein